MEQLTKKAAAPRYRFYLSILLVLFLIVFGGNFVITRAIPYYGFDREFFGHYWNVRWLLVLHITGGILAMVTGPFQFWMGLRDRYMNVHRNLGRTYVIAILISCVASTILAWTSAIQLNFSWALGLQALALAWFVTTSMAFVSVRRGRILQHKDWMIRSYVVTFAFVLFRFLVDLPLFVSQMPKFEERGPAAIWFSWAVPLLITEAVLSWNKRK